MLSARGSSLAPKGLQLTIAWPWCWQIVTCTKQWVLPLLCVTFILLSEPWDVLGVLHRANLRLGAHKACFISQGKWKRVSMRTNLHSPGEAHQLGCSYIHSLHVSVRTTNNRCMTSVRPHHVLHQSVFVLHWQRALSPTMSELFTNIISLWGT